MHFKECFFASALAKDGTIICSLVAIQLFYELQGKPKTNIVVAVRRRVVVAIGSAAVLRIVVPTTTAIHAIRAL